MEETKAKKQQREMQKNNLRHAQTDPNLHLI